MLEWGLNLCIHHKECVSQVIKIYVVVNVFLNYVVSVAKDRKDGRKSGKWTRTKQQQPKPHKE